MGYPGEKSGSWNEVVQGLTMQLRHGRIGCLLGPSGCGKSTVLRAICGFEPIQAGEITLDKQVVSSPETTLAPEKRRVGVVFQDYALFPHLTNAQNVAFGLRDLPKKEALQKAEEWLERVGLKNVGSRYPHELSGGQRQRLAIARAIYKDAPILILDEATSALDSESERQVQDALDRLMAGRTTLVIAHRLSTIEHANRIVVLEHGQIIENGSHDALIQQDGLYASLHRIQFSNS